MKQHVYYIFLIGFLLKSIGSFAQNDTLDCESHLEKAITYLKTPNYTPQDSIKAVKLLKPCVKREQAYSQLLMGRLYLESHLEAHHNKGFKLIKKAAKQDLALACSDLADLYKYGISCDLDYNKAKKWYKKAHKLGDAKGTYGLAYLHYKGLGGLTQNYTKAVKLFKKSEYPMAKHWLATAYYFGYGVEKDTEKALSLLKVNNIKNSEILLDCMTFHLKNAQELPDETELISTILLNDETPSNHDFYPEQLNGNWSGSLIQLDWSGKTLLQTFPVTLSLAYDEVEKVINYNWSFNTIETKGVATNENNTLQFENLEAKISRLYFSDKKEQQVNYTIESGEFALKTHKQHTYLTALLDNYAPQMSEPGNRLALLLTKEEARTENGKTISANVASALNDQEDFIKLYPNPLENDLYLSYHLEAKGIVQVEVSGLHGAKKQVLEQSKQQEPGRYTYYLEASSLEKGMHVVTVVINGKKHTKLIVKN